MRYLITLLLFVPIFALADVGDRFEYEGETYVISEGLGSGGFGDTFAARSLSSYKQMAVKFLDEENKKYINLPAYERIGALVDQVPGGRYVLGYRTASAVFYRQGVRLGEELVLISDRLAGSLDEYLDELSLFTSPPESRLLDLGEQEFMRRLDHLVAIAGQISFGHRALYEMGYLQRDGKPGNFFLATPPGEVGGDVHVLWADHDVAVEIRAFDPDVSSYGTPNYVPLEAVLGLDSPQDGRFYDQFSASATLAFMAFGAEVFREALIHRKVLGQDDEKSKEEVVVLMLRMLNERERNESWFLDFLERRYFGAIREAGLWQGEAAKRLDFLYHFITGGLRFKPADRREYLERHLPDLPIFTGRAHPGFRDGEQRIPSPAVEADPCDQSNGPRVERYFDDLTNNF